jgi:hypothetical protein
MLRLVVLLTCATLTNAASADSVVHYRGTQLLAFCESTDATSKAVCMGFVTGVADAMADPYLSKLPSCTPLGSDARQIALIVEKFMRENPTLLHYSAAENTALALQKAFPCK